MEVARVLERLETRLEGLDDAEVRRRQSDYGPNVLAEQGSGSLIEVVFDQFRSPLITILVIATIVTILLGHLLDAAVIGAVLVLNAVVGSVQERRAETAVRALMSLVVPKARVIRGGHEIEVDGRGLVPGDIVTLEPGVRVPADLRLVSSRALRVDESLLTGESVPVDKAQGPVGESSVLADRTSMAYTGATVTGGRGRGVAVAIGDRTELGAIAELVRSETRRRTPLQDRMDRLARLVGFAVAVACVVAFVSGVALGGEVEDMFLTSVALAVAAIPEGLPVAFTITMALGVHRMARRNAVIRRLPAVETLGSTTVIGSDKTGTLTQNRMTVTEIWTARGVVAVDVDDPGEPVAFVGSGAIRSGFPRDEDVSEDDASIRLAVVEALTAAVLTNEAQAVRGDEGWVTAGDPTEIALLLAAHGAGMEPSEVIARAPVIAEIPFESERRFSASVCEHLDDSSRHVLWVKGAPEAVVSMCGSIAYGEDVGPLDADAVLEVAEEMAGRGLRVLATARRRLDHHVADGADLEDPEGLVFTGLFGLIDPPRPGVPEAIVQCRQAGVGVVMITGDHAVTARAIAAELGLESPQGVMTGAELAGLDTAALADRMGHCRVFARVAPEDKLRIVDALQFRGEVVAVTGDGVNDAPALRAADIGVAMGLSGTDVAREAADMVLTDDDFVSITAAVEEGRITFDNVRKVTFFLLSTAAATILAILVGVWASWPLVMAPVQLLWLNLVTNGVQDIALAFEPGEPGLLDRPPRPRREGILSRVLWQRTVLAGAVMASCTLAMFRWELERSGSEIRAQSVALTTMVVAMAFHVGSSRSERESVLSLSPWSNRFLVVASAAALGLHLASLHLAPTQYLLGVEPLDLAAWIRVVPAAGVVLVVVEADKAVRRLRSRRRAR